MNATYRTDGNSLHFRKMTTAVLGIPLFDADPEAVRVDVGPDVSAKVGGSYKRKITRVALSS